MPSRIAEVIYRLKDLFTGPTQRIVRGYDNIKRSSRETAQAVEQDNSRLSKSFSVVGTALRRFVGPLAAVFTAASATRATSSLADELDRLGKTAANLDIDPTALSGLGFAADRSGVPIQKLNSGLFTLQKRTGEAVQGLGAARQAFEQLSIDAAQFSQLDTVAQFELLADRLSEIENASERAALASALFSKEAGRELQKLLSQGSAAIRDYVREATDYREVTQESVDAAAQFNDILTNFGRRASGIVQSALLPLIRGFNRLGEALGLATEKAPELTVQLARARAELETLQRTAEQGSRRRNPQLQAQLELVERLEKAVQQEIDALRKSAAADRARIKQRAEAEAAEKAYLAQLESVTRAIDNRADSAERALTRETEQLRAARAEQASIEERFRQLREDVTAPAAEDLSGLDVQQRVLEARRQLAQGDADAAIRAADQGADLLRDLKAEGEEAGFVLGFLADQLANVAQEAAKQQADREAFDVAEAAQRFNAITEQLNALQSDAAQAGTEIGRAIVANINAELQGAAFGAALRAGLADARRRLEREGLK